MTCREIQQRLMVERYRRSFVMPNYTPKDWFECDVFEMSPAGYFTEFEIKMSLQDFKADGRKKRERLGQWNESNRRFDVEVESKHDLLDHADVRCPSKFYFVIPATQIEDRSLGIVPLEIVPDWAGLIHAVTNNHNRAPYCVRLEVIRKAPQIHHQKANPEILKHATSTCYWRMHNLLLYGKASIDHEDHQQIMQLQDLSSA